MEKADLGERRFDVVFAVRVGIFHREPERARALVEPWLACQPPCWKPPVVSSSEPAD
jgi:hypothetical protein